MQNNLDFRSRWEGMLALFMALPIFGLACISFSISLFWSESSSWWKGDSGASLMLLLSYIVLAIYVIRTRQPLRLLMLRYALRTALPVGLLIGAALLWPALSENWRWLAIMLMILVPFFVLTDPLYIFTDFPWNFLIFLLTVACIFLYGRLGYQLMRHTARMIYSLGGAFFAGLFAPLSLAFLISVVRDIPWILRPNEISMLEKLEYFYLHLLNDFFAIYSQVLLALLAGLVGALLARRRRADTADTPE